LNRILQRLAVLYRGGLRSAILEHGDDKNLRLAQRGFDLADPRGAELGQSVALQGVGVLGGLSRAPRPDRTGPTV
jgi:hypothetical protein